MKKISIVISYYKALDNLKIILNAFNVQSDLDFEIILSEDDNNQETRDFLRDFGNDYRFSILHEYQTEDLGFRKNMMLNRSIMRANTEWIVFIDGDCVPHRHFVKEHIKSTQDGYILSGRRVMLSQKISDDILNGMPISKLGFWRLLFSGSEKVKEGIYSPFLNLSTTIRGLVGCNWAAKKEDLLQINGYDEDYVSAGVGEDSDIEWRIEGHGLKKKSVKNKALMYHLYHPRSYSEDNVLKNMKLMNEKKMVGNIRCLNGIKKLSD